jgi:hypothetical protein
MLPSSPPKFVYSIDAEPTYIPTMHKNFFGTELQSVNNESSLTGMHTVRYSPAFSNTLLYSIQVDQEYMYVKLSSARYDYQNINKEKFSRLDTAFWILWLPPPPKEIP